MAEQHLDGWTVAVCQGAAEPFFLAGVPPVFLIVDFLGTIFGAFVATFVVGLLAAFSVLVYGGIVYLIGMALTAWEPCWWSMLRAYWKYETYYEG